jgi:hypothetical protein
METKMYCGLHVQFKKLDILISISSFIRKYIVGCIFNSVGFIIIREIPCIIFRRIQNLKFIRNFIIVLSAFQYFIVMDK